MATAARVVSLPLPPLASYPSAHCRLPHGRKAPPPLVAAKKARGLIAVSVEAAVPRSVPVRVAYELQQAGHRYLDVRTEGEFSAGHPQGAVNVPYMHKNGSGMAKNPHFLDQVSMIFDKDAEIIVGCQSGKRSLMAAAELCAAGFNAVTDIAGGFSSWRDNGLPVNQQRCIAEEA